MIAINLCEVQVDSDILFQNNPLFIYNFTILGQSFFYFFVLQTLPTQFFGNWKKNKRDFFQFYFFISLRLMPVQDWSSIMFFRFVFFITARLIKLKIKFIRTIFQLN